MKISGGSIKPTLGDDLHRLAKFRAASMGVPLAEFVRTAVARYMKSQPGFVHEPAVAGVNCQCVDTPREIYTGMTSEEGPTRP